MRDRPAGRGERIRAGERVDELPQHQQPDDGQREVARPIWPPNARPTHARYARPARHQRDVSLRCADRQRRREDRRSAATSTMSGYITALSKLSNAKRISKPMPVCAMMNSAPITPMNA